MMRIRISLSLDDRISQFKNLIKLRLRTVEIHNKTKRHECNRMSLNQAFSQYRRI